MSAIPAGYKQTEVGVIPEDWEVKAIKQFASVKGGKRLPLGKFVVERVTPHPYLRVTDMRPGGVNLSDIKYVPEDAYPAIKNYRIFTNDIFVSVAGSLGIVGKIPAEIDGANLTENADKITDIECDRDFLLYNLMTERIQGVIESERTVGAQPKLALGRIENFTIALPRDRDEQRAIAAALSDVDALLAKLDQLIAKKRDLKQAAMQQLLTGQTRLPGFSGEWEVKRLGDVLRFQVGFPFGSDFFNQEGDGVRLIKNRDLKADDQIFFFSGKFDDAFLVNNDDVLIGMDGDFLPCLWSKGKALLNQRVGRILPSPSLSAVFSYYMLTEPLKVIEYATSATTVKHLSHGDVEGIERALPGYEEQTAIATVLSDMDAELAALIARRDKTCALKQGMMQELLTGKIRLI